MNRTDTTSGGAADQPSWFQATHWSLILAIGQGDTVQAANAREELCRTYWHAVYGFVRRRGYSVEDAQDLTQMFLARLLEKNAFQKLDPQRGKFRNFLQTALRNFLASQYRQDQAQKRYPGKPLVPLDDAEQRYLNQAAAGWAEEMIFDRQWALAIIERALTRLRGRHAARGKTGLFERLAEYLAREPAPGEYDVLGQQWGMQNKAVAMAVSRLRREYGQLVREEVRQTVADEHVVAEEMRYLIEVLSR